MAVTLRLREIKEAIVMGWKVEANWSNPFIFLAYFVLKPLFGLLLVVVIFLVGSSVGRTFNTSYLAYLFIGTTFFILVTQLTASMGWLIHEDRAKYEVLKHIYITPGSLFPYLLGRSLAIVAYSIATIAIIIAIGYPLLSIVFNVNLPIDFSKTNLSWLFLSMVVGIMGVIAIGYILCGINLVSSKLQFTIGEYMSGLFFLLGGVAFPPEVMPEWLSPLSKALPVTHYLQSVRASVLNDKAAFAESFLLLSLTSAITIMLGVTIFKLAEKRCKKLGLIDRKAEY